MTDAYNGWKNRETWAAHLWLTKDPDVYQWARGQTADSLKDAFETANEARDAVTGFYFHALRDIGSLWRVDWNEVSKALTD